MKFIYINLLIFLFVFNGCSWLNFSKQTPQRTAIIPSVSLSRIIDQNRLFQGGKIYVKFFQPGVGVLANEQSDKLSLMILRGIGVMINETSGSFQIILEENYKEADLIIDGHLVEVGSTPKWHGWFMRPDKGSVEIKGRLYEKESGKVIAIFKEHMDFNRKKKSFEEIALILGQNIGSFLLESL
ncbi:MAG: hypothetical protein K8S27_15405 [Candidatus Omnitrophica bacterium]|nr:hypothetical protein [Candidatus Omnitrophota bacterium]